MTDKIPDDLRAKAEVIARITAKADELLKKGDAAGGHLTAEGRRLLRECRRYRKRAREIKGLAIRSPS